MKRLHTFVAIVALVLSATVAFAQTETSMKAPYYGYEKVTIAGASWVVPDYINIEKFPPLGGKLTERDARILELHQEPLKAPGWYVNELRERHTFEVVWLEKGEMVWVGNTGGEPRYRASCGNRISFLLSHDITYFTPSSPAVPPTTINPGGVHKAFDNGGGTGYIMPEWLRSFWHGLLSVLLLLLGLALIVAGLYLLALAVREAVENWNKRKQPKPTPTTPVVVPMPKSYRQSPVAKQTAAGGAPELATATTDPVFHRFGPFDHIMIDDAGDKGYKVTGVNDGEEFLLGTFRWAQSENAGTKGEYVVVLI